MRTGKELLLVGARTALVRLADDVLARLVEAGVHTEKDAEGSTLLKTAGGDVECLVGDFVSRGDLVGGDVSDDTGLGA